MIRVTIWNEHYQDRGDEVAATLTPTAENEGHRQWLISTAAEIKQVHPHGMNATLKSVFAQCDDIHVRTVTQDMPDCGLSEEILGETDVLIYWAHCLHADVTDEAAERVRSHVLCGMGFIPLHSAHPSKPMQRLLGTTGALKWREGDFCRVWNTCPTHPIAIGIPEYIELEEEEMYGEYFDIPKPDDVVFTSWFSGGEIFRSGCTWVRGYGRIFYFQPGHETNPSYAHPAIRQILINAVRWAAPAQRVVSLDCPKAVPSPEEKRLRK